VALTAVLGLGACGATGAWARPLSGISQTTQHGYVVLPTALEQVPPAPARTRCLSPLARPPPRPTTATTSSTNQQNAPAPGRLHAGEVIDQRVFAVYFNEKNQVDHVANYGLKDGKVFDFISRTTDRRRRPELLAQVLAGVIGSAGRDLVVPVVAGLALSEPQKSDGGEPRLPRPSRLVG